MGLSVVTLTYSICLLKRVSIYKKCMLVYLFGVTANYSSKLLEILVFYKTAKENNFSETLFYCFKNTKVVIWIEVIYKQVKDNTSF